jgi:hypothetical protein
MATLAKWAVRRAVHDDRSAVLKLWESVGLTSADENEWQALHPRRCGQVAGQP